MGLVPGQRLLDSFLLLGRQRRLIIFRKHRDYQDDTELGVVGVSNPRPTPFTHAQSGHPDLPQATRTWLNWGLCGIFEQFVLQRPQISSKNPNRGHISEKYPE